MSAGESQRRRMPHRHRPCLNDAHPWVWLEAPWRLRSTAVGLVSALESFGTIVMLVFLVVVPAILLGVHEGGGVAVFPVPDVGGTRASVDDEQGGVGLLLAVCS